MGEIKKENSLNKCDLLILFEKFIVESGYLIINYKDLNGCLDNFHSFVVEKDKKQIEIIFNIRNISNAYLPNKPEIKRRQVGKLTFEKLPPNKRNRVVMLLGLKIIYGDPILVCWNPFYFIGHETNRSCYVLDSTMIKTYQSGFYSGENCKTKLYACSGINFGQLLDLYISENAVE